VVSYNSALLLKYNAHINVQIAHTVLIIKDLHKDMHNGPDIVYVSQADDNTVDELQRNKGMKSIPHVVLYNENVQLPRLLTD
jgi:hypothetical protein